MFGVWGLAFRVQGLGLRVEADRAAGVKSSEHHPSDDAPALDCISQVRV